MGIGLLESDLKCSSFAQIADKPTKADQAAREQLGTDSFTLQLQPAPDVDDVRYVPRQNLYTIIQMIATRGREL